MRTLQINYSKTNGIISTGLKWKDLLIGYNPELQRQLFKTDGIWLKDYSIYLNTLTIQKY